MSSHSQVYAMLLSYPQGTNTQTLSSQLHCYINFFNSFTRLEGAFPYKWTLLQFKKYNRKIFRWREYHLWKYVGNSTCQKNENCFTIYNHNSVIKMTNAWYNIHTNSKECTKGIIVKSDIYIHIYISDSTMTPLVYIYEYIYIYIIQQFVNKCRFYESTLLNYAYPCRNWTFQRFARAAQRKDATEQIKNLTLAGVRFFICSVASFLLCCPCEALEGPISTRVGIIQQRWFIKPTFINELLNYIMVSTVDNKKKSLCMYIYIHIYTLMESSLNLILFCFVVDLCIYMYTYIYVCMNIHITSYIYIIRIS